MLSGRLTLYSLLGLWLLAGGTIQAEDEPLPGRFEIEVGGYFVTRIDTVAQFARKVGPIEAGAIIDMGKDLGLSESKSIPRLDGVFRFNTRSSLDFSWWEIDRNATTVVGKDIDFGDISIPVDERVEAFFDTQTIRVSYGYSFYNVPKAELGVNAGLHVTIFDLGITCLTCTTLGTLDTESVTAPLPVFGFHFRYQMSRRWSFTGYTQHFLVEFGDFDGSLTDTRVSFSHHTFKNVGFGFGWNRIETDLDIDTDDYVMAVANKLEGVQAFVVVYAGKTKNRRGEAD